MDKERLHYIQLAASFLRVRGDAFDLCCFYFSDFSQSDGNPRCYVQLCNILDI